jgi:hypothetical protein
MKNITVSVDEETYRRARIWAAERGTSVSAVVKCILTTLPARTYSPPRRHRPDAGQPGVEAPSKTQHAAPAPPPGTALIPSWGLTVLRATCAQFPPEVNPEANPESN